MISVVLPCYNPLDDWCRTVLDHMSELNRLLTGYTVQYIISNDGSTRLNLREIDIVTAFPHVIFLNNQVNEGKGSAIRKGMKHAEGNIIIYTDIDFPFGTSPIVEMVKIFEKNPQTGFVYGSRNIEYFKKLPLKRQLVSKGLHLLNQIFLADHIIDTQAGIKGLRREVLADVLNTKTNTFVFEIELIHKLVRKKIEIRSVEVSANPAIVFSDFSFKVIFREAVSLVRIMMMSGIWNNFS